MHTCTKLYSGFPFAHRQHTHDGHCSLIHGHNWDFEFTFAADSLDACGFVADFGKLKWLKAWLDDRFDHTLVLNEDDPQLPHLRRALEEWEMSKIVVVPNCGAEGLAQWIAGQVNAMLGNGGPQLCDTDPPPIPHDWVDRQVRVTCVRVFEDHKNHATYHVL